MGYICAKKLRLAGRDYLPGDFIPEEVFASGRANKLKVYGYITEAASSVEDNTQVVEGTDGEAPLHTFYVTLDRDETGMRTAYPITDTQLQTAVDIMQKSAADAAAAVGDEVDETVLTFVVKVDSRKTVAQAAQKQLSAIAAVQADQ